MSITARRGWQPGSPNRWLIVGGAAAALVLVSGAIAAGLGSGIFNRSPIPGPVAVSPSPSPSLSPAASPSPSPTATPSPTPPPSALAALNCRIAISNGESGSGGWITFPGGQFTLDPTSRVSTPSGVGSYSYGLTHDLALNRWLPVRREWVTPDGRSYVYSDWQWSSPVIESIDADGGVHWLATPPAGSNLLSAEPEGVYVDTEPGLSLISWNGQSRQLTATGYWQAIGNGGAYGTASRSLPTGAANTIIRLDLRTGATTDVFSAPGLTSRVAGFGAGEVPVVEASGRETFEVWLVASTPVRLISEQRLAPNAMGQWLYLQSALGDSHGTWIATSQALYLYTPGAGLEQASTVTGQLASNCR